MSSVSLALGSQSLHCCPSKKVVSQDVIAAYQHILPSHLLSLHTSGNRSQQHEGVTI